MIQSRNNLSLAYFNLDMLLVLYQRSPMTHFHEKYTFQERCLWQFPDKAMPLSLTIVTDYISSIYVPFICLLITLLLITSCSSYSETFTNTIIKTAIAFIRIMLAKPNRKRFTLSFCSSGVNSNPFFRLFDFFLLRSPP